jgi:hypothetical protein
MHLTARRGGFSLIEAVVAVAILAVTCVAVSPVIGATLRVEGTLERRRHLEAVLAAESERLTALPYYRRASGSERPASPVSLLGEVFPHAAPACNAPDAYFVSGSAEAEPGSFVSHVSAGDLTVRRVARFVTASSAGLQPVPASDLSAWAVWSEILPPTGVLEVDLRVTERGLSVARRLVLSVAPPALAADAASSASVGEEGDDEG